jgi:hypothetical protein
MPEKTRIASFYYTEEENTLFRNIAKSPRNTWREKIDELVPTMPGKNRDTIYQKVHFEAQKLGNVPDTKKSAISKKGAATKKVKKATVVKHSTSYPVLKSSKVHPMKGGSVKVSPTEIRFPYKGIRLENGEVIISI